MNTLDDYGDSFSVALKNYVEKQHNHEMSAKQAQKLAKSFSIADAIKLSDAIENEDARVIRNMLLDKLGIEEASSPWTSSGKHPEDMSREELQHEIDIFKQYQKAGMSLSPQEIMRMDSLYDYLNNECRYCGGDCPNDEDNACDGYLGDIDNLYGTKTDEGYGVNSSTPTPSTTQMNKIKRDTPTQKNPAVQTQRNIQPTGQGARLNVPNQQAQNTMTMQQNTQVANANSAKADANRRDIENLKKMAGVK